MQVDVRVDNHGSVVVMTGLSEAGEEWLSTMLEHGQMWGRGYVVEPRYVAPIVAGLQEFGLEVAE